MSSYATLAGMTPPTVHHVSLNVDDLGAAAVFYVRLLGLTRRPGRPDFGVRGCWLDVGPVQVHLTKSAVPADLGQHVALLVENVARLAGTLRSAGVRVVDRQLPDSRDRQVFAYDPAGNLLELQQAP
jgi:catechol 2,3-dioxygenase-like lactoylglutathione lyase family enzyme